MNVVLTAKESNTGYRFKISCYFVPSQCTAWTLTHVIGVRALVKAIKYVMP